MQPFHLENSLWQRKAVITGQQRPAFFLVLRRLKVAIPPSSKAFAH
jgi:hypothetical protein